MKSLKKPTSLFLLALLGTCILASHAAAQSPEIQEIWFGKTAFHQQLGDKEPVLDPVHPYAFSSKCIINGGKILSASVTFNGSSYEYIKTGEAQAEIFTLFKTQQDLTDYFPSGNYTLSIQSTSGFVSTILRNETPFFPIPPKILSGNNTCWINEVMVITSNKTDVTLSWINSNENVYEVWIADAKEGKTLPFNQSSYTLTKNYIDALPFDTPVYQLVQFNSYLGNAATTFYLYKPSPLNNESFLLMTKMRAFLQTSNNSILDWGAKKETVFFDEYGPYSFSIESSNPNTITSPSSSTIHTKEAWIKDYRFNSGSIATKTELDQIFPDGNYTAGDQVVKLFGASYPNNSNPIKILRVNGKLPLWENGKLVIDSKIRNRIEWTPLARGRTKFEITFDISYIQGFQENLFNLESGSFKSSKIPFSSFTIPANSMKTTNNYFLSIKYFNYCADLRARYGISTFVWVAPK